MLLLFVELLVVFFLYAGEDSVIQVKPSESGVMFPSETFHHVCIYVAFSLFKQVPLLFFFLSSAKTCT